MFAVIPLIGWLVIVVGGLGGVGGGVYGVAKLIKWLKSDPHRDFILTLGPKMGGKTELKEAMLGRPYNKERVGTVSWNEPASVGGDKYIAAISDCGGEENHIKENCLEVMDYLKMKQSKYVLTLFIFDLKSLHEKGVLDVADSLCLYVKMLRDAIAGLPPGHYARSVYESGNWYCGIIGTHKDCVVDVPSLKEMESTLFDEKIMGKIRPIGKRIRFVDLKCDKGRKEALESVVGYLKEMHEA